jgi:hypothetical protein
LSDTSIQRPSTCSIRAGLYIADQAAALLSVDWRVCREAFLNRPIKQVLAVTEWVLRHQEDKGFDPEAIILGWHRNRRREAKTLPCADCGGRFRGRDLTEVGDDRLTWFEAICSAESAPVATASSDG